LVAVDVDPYNFSRLAADFGIETMLCDIEEQRLEIASSTVDAVLAFHLIEHLRSPDNLMAEAHRVLKPYGKFFLVTPDWRKQYLTFWRDPTHRRPYDKESLARLFRIYRLQAEVFSWGPRFGFGRIEAYRWFPRLGMIGMDVLVIGTKVPQPGIVGEPACAPAPRGSDDLGEL